MSKVHLQIDVVVETEAFAQDSHNNGSGMSWDDLDPEAKSILDKAAEKTLVEFLGGRLVEDAD